MASILAGALSFLCVVLSHATSSGGPHASAVDKRRAFCDTLGMVNPCSPDRLVVIAGGDPERWQVFRQDGDQPVLPQFRAFVASLDPDKDGILAVGAWALSSHMGEVARLSGLPAVFCPVPQGAASDLVLCERHMRSSRRRDRVRLLVRSRGVRVDERGNVRSADVSFLDRTWQGPRWVRWRTGMRVCLAEFRVEMLDTPRAGIHFRIGVADVDGPRDLDGYRIDPPRFLSSFRMATDGLGAVIPCDPVRPFIPVEGGSSGDPVEDRLLELALRVRFGCSAAEADMFLAANGPEGDAPAGYAFRKAA